MVIFRLYQEVEHNCMQILGVGGGAGLVGRGLKQETQSEWSQVILSTEIIAHYTHYIFHIPISYVMVYNVQIKNLQQKKNSFEVIKVFIETR